MDKNTWKEIAIILSLLWAILFVLVATDPSLILAFFDGFRRLFGL